MPHNFGVEQSVLGALIFDNTQLDIVRNKLSEVSFYGEQHVTIWKALVSIRDSGAIANDKTLIEFFEREDNLKKIGGEEYLAKMVGNAALGPEVEEFAQMLLELENRRSLIQTAQAMEASALRPKLNETAAQIAGETQKIMSKVIVGSATFTPPVQAVPGIKSMVHNIKNRDRKKPSSLSTGMDFLDKRLGGGLFPPDLIILAGRPSMGKTTIANQIALNVSRQPSLKVPDRTASVLYHSLEMRAEQLEAKFMTANSYGEYGKRYDSKKIRNQTVSDVDLDTMEYHAEQRIGDIHIDDRGGVALQDVQTAAHSHIRINGFLDLIVIDYLQICKFISQGGWSNKSEMIGDFTTGVKNLGKQLNIPVLLLSQLSREVEKRDDKRPQLSDLRESGSIEQDADVVVFVYREEYYLKRSEPKEGSEKHAEWKLDMIRVEHEVTCIAAKQRHGPIGSDNGYIDLQTGYVGDCSPTSEYGSAAWCDRQWGDENLHSHKFPLR